MNPVILKEVLKYGGTAAALVFIGASIYMRLEKHDERAILQATESQQFIKDAAVSFSQFAKTLDEVADRLEKSTKAQEEVAENIKDLERTIRLYFVPRSTAEIPQLQIP